MLLLIILSLCTIHCIAGHPAPTQLPDMVDGMEMDFISSSPMLMDSFVQSKPSTVKDCSCFNGPTSSSPDIFKRLPSVVEKDIFHWLGNVKEVASCLRVCKRWSELVSTTLLDTSKFNSVQDFLQNYIEDGLSESSKDSKIFVKSLLKSSVTSTSLCSVPLQFWLQSLAKNGDINELENWFQKNVDSHSVQVSYLFSGALFNVIHDRNVLVRVMTWVLEKLNYLETQNAPVYFWKLQLLYQALENGVMEIVLDPGLATVRSTQDHSSLLEYGIKSQDRTTFEWVINQLPEFEDVSEFRTIDSTLAACHVCSREDIERLMRRFAHADYYYVMENVLLYAIQLNNMYMVQLLLDSYDFVKVEQVHFYKSLATGNMELVKLLMSKNQDFILDYHAIVLMEKHATITSLHLIDDFILENAHQLTREQASQLMSLYAQYACGNVQDVEALKTLTRLYPESVTLRHLRQAIERPDFKPPPSERPPAGLGRFCKKNESTQIIEWLLKKGKIPPTQEHVDAALKRGRLDIVKLVYETGVERGADLILDEASFLDILNERRSRTRLFASATKSYQEPLLLDYVLEHAVKHVPLEDQATEKVRILNDHMFSKMETHFVSKFDCYFQHARERLAFGFEHLLQENDEMKDDEFSIYL